MEAPREGGVGGEPIECRNCKEKKGQDQFWALRGPRKLVTMCLDCRKRQKELVSYCTLSSLSD